MPNVQRILMASGDHTHIASPVSQLQENGVQKGSFWCLSGYGD